MKFSDFNELFRVRLKENPEKTAILREKGGRIDTVSWRAFDRDVEERSIQLTECLKSSEGILQDGSYGAIVEIFAAVRAGLNAVLLDAGAPEEVLKEQILETDVDLLYGDEDLTEALDPYLTAGVKERAGRVLFFTSGTTSRSKAVVLSPESLMASAYNGGALLPLSPDDRLMQLLPMNHVFGFVCGLLWGLSCNAEVALGRGARHYADDLKYFQPTAVSVVPLLLGFLLKYQALNPELKLILVGAGDCPMPLLMAVKALGIRLSFGYGLTETSSGVALSLGEDPYEMTVCPEDRITIAEDGEILIEAPTCVMEGYYKRPEETKEALSDGILRTGDLGRLDEAGHLFITGRKKEILVLSDGTKIYLPEYEAALRDALPEADIAVVSEGGAPVLVYYGAFDETEVLLRIREKMAALPRGRQIQKVVRTGEPLPRTATGKIKRWEIVRKLEEI